MADVVAHKSKKLSLIVPTYNEAAVIERTVRDFHQALKEKQVDHEILIVHGRSTDNTEEILIKLEKEIPELRHINEKPPFGFGYAIRYGLENFTGDAVAIVMADRVDDPKDLLRFWEKYQEGYDCVFGSRFSKGSYLHKYPPFKLVLNRIFNVFLMALFQIRYNDTSNSFKLYSRKFIEEVSPLESDYFNITIELPLKVIVRGYKYAVVPNNWTNTSKKVSNLSIRKMTYYYFKTAFKALFERWFYKKEVEKTPVERKKKLLVVGASSFIGRRIFAKAVERDLDVIGTYHKSLLPGLVELDITSEEKMKALLEETKPDSIVWVAAEKNVKKIENHPEEALKINTLPIESLVRSLQALGLTSRIIFISSDYVFDGKNGPYEITDKTCPHTVYGKTKLKAENFLKDNWHNYSIVRTSAVMGKGGAFFDFLADSVQKSEEVDFFDNLKFSPTPIGFLVDKILEISFSGNPHALYHVVGDRVFSRFDFAVLAKRAFSGKATIQATQAKEGELFSPNMTLKPSVPFIPQFDWEKFIKEEALL